MMFRLVTFHLSSFVFLSLYLIDAAQNATYSYDKVKRSISVPDRYIVRFSKNNNPQIIDQFYADLESRGIHVEPRFRIVSDTFTATSFDLPTGIDTSIISKLRNVENQWPVKSIPLSGKTVSGNVFGLVEKWNVFKENTGVTELHGLGIKGDGVTVAIIDTGINFKHPALGNGIGPNKKIKAEYDFQGSQIIETRPEDNSKDCVGHGTNIAGVLAAEDDKYKLVGVAPNVNLLSYKVAACGEESSETDKIIAAIDHASKQNVDIIQLAQGAPNGWADNALAAAVSAYAAKGIFVSVSGGNRGNAGVFNADEGASGKNAMAVGAIADTRYSLWQVEVDFGGDKNSIPVHWHLTTNFPEPPRDKRLFATSKDITFNHDACAPLKTKRLDNYLVLVRRSSQCDFTTQLEHLGVQRANAVLFYNNHEPYAVPDVESIDDIQYGMITAQAGEWLAETLNKGESIGIKFLERKASSYGGLINLSTMGRMYTGSSWGPSNNFAIKPEISAPGQDIATLGPGGKGAYQLATGTSVASPFIAGIAALYIGTHGKLARPEDALTLKNRIITSGNPVPWYDGDAIHLTVNAPVSQVGGGYVDAWKVVTYQTSISPGKIELGPSSRFQPYHKVVITNNGDSRLEYSVDHTPDQGVLTLEDDGKEMMPMFPPLLVPHVKAGFRAMPDAFALGPGKSIQLEMVFEHPPSTLEDKLFPTYSGRIDVKASNGENLVIPYLGVVGDTKNIKVIASDSYFMHGPDDVKLREEGIEIIPFDQEDTLKVDLRLIWGTPGIRLELVEPGWTVENWKFKPTSGRNKYVGRIAYGDGEWNTWIPRTEDGGERWDVKMSSWITGDNSAPSRPPDGTYRCVVSALKPDGQYDPSDRRNWDFLVSPVFRVSDVSGPPTKKQKVEEFSEGSRWGLE